MNTFDELTLTAVKEQRDKQLIVDGYQAYGWLSDCLERFWKAVRTEDEDALTPLVGLASSCQIIAESFFCLPHRDTSIEDYLKEELDKAINLLMEILNYINKTGKPGPAQQLGKKPTINVLFDATHIEKIQKILENRRV